MKRDEKELQEERRTRLARDVEEAVRYAERRHSMSRLLEHPATILRRDRERLNAAL